MGFFDAYRRTRLALSVPESMATLEHMEEYFSDRSNWTQNMYENANGARCLVGAANHEVLVNRRRETLAGPGDRRGGARHQTDRGFQ